MLFPSTRLSTTDRFGRYGRRYIITLPTRVCTTRVSFVTATYVMHGDAGVDAGLKFGGKSFFKWTNR